MSPYLLRQIPYAVFVITLFLGYGLSVRKGRLRGKRILTVGLLVGVLAVLAAAVTGLPDLLSGRIGLGAFLVNPLMMAMTAAYCIVLSYRMHQSYDVASYALGDTKVLIRVCGGGAQIPDADALILPTNTMFRMAGGAAGPLGAAAGPDVAAEAGKHAPAGLLKVVATPPGRLEVGRIYHVAVHEPGKPTGATAVRQGIENAARQARKAGAESVVVPVAWYRGLPIEQMAAAAAEGILKNRKAFAEIVFAILDPRDARLVQEALRLKIEAVEPGATAQNEGTPGR
ncbi:MAG TPA: macro domain-containing protein [Armatimonadaceae bacterium]|nr:macro domain-containing protein [Armatimonadaceae bacterium]